MDQTTKDSPGITATLIGRITDISYTGVRPRPKGSGIVGSIVNDLYESGKSNQGEVADSTKACHLVHIPIDEVERVKQFTLDVERSKVHAFEREIDLLEKVRNFHEQLNQLKRKALKGRTKRTITDSELEAIKSGMIPFNVGKCIKVSIQLRVFSLEPRPNMNKVRTGGYSRVRSVCTYYLPWTEGVDLEEVLKTESSHWTTLGDGSVQDITIASTQNVIEQVDDKRIVIRPGREVAMISRLDKDGKGIHLQPLAGAKSKDAFAKLYDDGLSRQLNSEGPKKTQAFKSSSPGTSPEEIAKMLDKARQNQANNSQS